MNDERNFRSLYYEKVGCKSVEEKKSLEILFKDNILDRNRIKQFCSRFTLPFIYRCYVWKFIFDIIPAQKKCHDFVMKQRTAQYEDLLSALKVIYCVNPELVKEKQFLCMWLLENSKLMYDQSIQLETEFHQNMLAITRTVIAVFENDVDMYWISKGLYAYVRSWYSFIPQLIEITKSILQKDDSVLYSYLEENEILENIPLETWFKRCFAGVLHDSALVKVWDKMISSSFKVLAILCSVLLTKIRRVLLTSINMADFLACVQSISNETADVIVNKALEVWQYQSRYTIQSPWCVTVQSPIRSYKLQTNIVVKQNL